MSCRHYREETELLRTEDWHSTRKGGDSRRCWEKWGVVEKAPATWNGE